MNPNSNRRTLNEKPKEVSIAVTLLWVSQVLGAITSLFITFKFIDIPGVVRGAAMDAFSAVFFLLPIYLLLLFKISQGRNWARVSYIPVYIILLFFRSTWAPALGLVASPLSYSLNTGLYTTSIIVGHAMMLYAFYLLFTSPGSLWFQKVRPQTTPDTPAASTPQYQPSQAISQTTNTTAMPQRTTAPFTSSSPTLPAADVAIEQQAWAQVSDEMEGGYTDKGLWARCFAESDGDETKTKARYMQARQQAIVLNTLKEIADTQAISAAQLEHERKKQIEEAEKAQAAKDAFYKDKAREIALIKESIRYGLEDKKIMTMMLKESNGDINIRTKKYIDYCLKNFVASDYENLEKRLTGKNFNSSLVMTLALIAFAVFGTLSMYGSRVGKEEAAVEAVAPVAVEAVKAAPAATTPTTVVQCDPRSVVVCEPLEDSAAANEAPKVNSETTDSLPNTPKFASYPPFNYYPGTVTHVNIEKGTDEYSFRTRLRYTIGLQPDFAGEHTLAVWGCGTSCLMGAFVNARTGDVAWLPGSVCCWYGEGERIIFHPDSRLLVLAGLVNEGEDYGLHFYEMNANGQLSDRIQFIPVKKPELYAE